MTYTRTSRPSSSGRRGEPGPREVDEVFDLLRNARRRYLLAALSTEDELGFDELVDAVAERERVERGLPLADGRHEQIRLVLFHNHLPKLEDADVVRCDYGDGTVRAVDHPKWELLGRLQTAVEESSLAG
ncbi:DUF7344 domain-containing protein [Halorarum salinum]|uniref:DUF7344 domain-containing protein n=1 Tax=Halorarum salinum TaxID=2743089 RepID=A0A7D5QEF3_9EURY|nr:hypothetical protein [Halobaculum salinum]QLG64199.1 hypothetical protein HUG12_20635 [Halobaculum salinum]